MSLAQENNIAFHIEHLSTPIWKGLELLPLREEFITGVEHFRPTGKLQYHCISGRLAGWEISMSQPAGHFLQFFKVCCPWSILLYTILCENQGQFASHQG